MQITVCVFAKLRLFVRSSILCECMYCSLYLLPENPGVCCLLIIVMTSSSCSCWNTWNRPTQLRVVLETSRHRSCRGISVVQVLFTWTTIRYKREDDISICVVFNRHIEFRVIVYVVHIIVCTKPQWVKWFRGWSVARTLEQIFSFFKSSVHFYVNVTAFQTTRYRLVRRRYVSVLVLYYLFCGRCVVKSSEKPVRY